jgi:hypothetical protein
VPFGACVLKPTQSGTATIAVITINIMILLFLPEYFLTFIQVLL